MSTKIQLSGGSFQDVGGSPLANGYLSMSLSQDGQVNSDAQIAAGYEITITLDSSGSVDTTTPQYVWPNDAITPVNTFYSVSAYSEDGQLVWGPNSQQVLSSPSPFDIGAWIPGIVSTSTNSADLLLQTNGVDNGSQTKLNLVAGTNVTLTEDGTGDVTIATSPGITLQTNGADNGSQTKLDLKAGTNITLSDDGSGGLTVTGATQISISQLTLSPSVPGNFTVAHGLGKTPTAVTLEMTSGGQIWFQTTRYDATNIYFVASDGGLTGFAKVWS